MLLQPRHVTLLTHVTPGSCTIWGDPHIKTFDSGLFGAEQALPVSILTSGDYWLALRHNCEELAGKSGGGGAVDFHMEIQASSIHRTINLNSIFPYLKFNHHITQYFHMSMYLPLCLTILVSMSFTTLFVWFLSQVKNQDIWIQGRYGTTQFTVDGQSALLELAISGPFIKNDTIIIQPMSGARLAVIFFWILGSKIR